MKNNFIIFGIFVILQQLFSFQSLLKTNMRHPTKDCNFNGFKYQNKCFCYSQFQGQFCEKKKLISIHVSEDDQCFNQLMRLDNLNNIQHQKNFNDDDLFPRLSGNSIGDINASYGETPTTWIKMHDLSSNFHIFDNNMSPRDIAQGALGNCYLLSALASLVAVKDGQIIKDIFLTKTDNEQHVYVTKWIIGGRPILVGVDEWIPGKDKQSSFSRLYQSNNFWAIILEKAWAKIYGQYMVTQGGDQIMIWKALTSARSTQISIKEWTSKQLYDTLKQCQKKGYPVGLASIGNFKKDLVQGHAYAFLNAYEVEHKNGSIYGLIKIMNPWNREIWLENEWANDSPIWKDIINNNIYIEHGYGIFHLEIEEAKQQFGIMEYAQIRKNYEYFWQDVPIMDQQEQYSALFRIEGAENKPSYIFIQQFDDKFLDVQNCGNPVEFIQGSMKVYNDDFKFQFKSSESQGWFNIFIRNSYNGKYYVTVQLHQIFHYQKYFTFSVYAPQGTVQFLDRSDPKQYYKWEKQCPNDCNFNGICNSYYGSCQCYKGYQGKDCSEKVQVNCPNNCNGHGKCNKENGICSCYWGYSGKDCHPCKDHSQQCNYLKNRGYCEDYSTNYDFMKNNCQKTCGHAGYKNFGTCAQIGKEDICDNVNCGQHGYCEYGQCICDIGYSGIYCQKEEPFICKDKQEDCADYYRQRDCQDQNQKRFLIRSCPKYCGYCQ